MLVWLASHLGFLVHPSLDRRYTAPMKAPRSSSSLNSFSATRLLARLESQRCCGHSTSIPPRTLPAHLLRNRGPLHKPKCEQTNDLNNSETSSSSEALSIDHEMWMCIYLPVRPFVCPSVCICLSLSVFVCLSVCLSSIYLLIYRSIYLSSIDMYYLSIYIPFRTEPYHKDSFERITK